eukprot:XP_022275124.1 uncharacterized protein LOC102153906 [Canis lupus familiaris]
MREQPSGGRESAVGAGRGSGPGGREGAPLVPRDRLPSLHACLPAVTPRWEGCSGKPPEAGGCSGAHAGLGEQEGTPAALLPPRGLGHSGGRHPSGLVPGDYPAHPRRFPLLPRAVPAARSLIRPGLRSRRRATCGGRVFVRRCPGPCKWRKARRERSHVCLYMVQACHHARLSGPADETISLREALVPVCMHFTYPHSWRN